MTSRLAALVAATSSTPRALFSSPRVVALRKSFVDYSGGEDLRAQAAASASRRLRTVLAAAAAVLLALACSSALFVGWTQQQSGVTLARVSPAERACELFCEGPVLAAVQSARLYNDSKTFVDMPALMDPPDIHAAFAARFPDYVASFSEAQGGPLPPHPPRDALLEFVRGHFGAPGSDLVPWVPPDWSPLPPQLVAVRNETLRLYVLGLNDLWLQLGRRLVDGVRAHPARHTLLHLPHPFIVPGGRFIETYYWDSYWIVLGLLRSGMRATAEGVVLNLVHLTAQLGFAPNGARAYYAVPGRAQPPLLSQMVREVFRASGNVTFLEHCYAALTHEYSWWMQIGTEYGHAVLVEEGRVGGDDDDDEEGEGGIVEEGGEDFIPGQPRRRRSSSSSRGRGRTHVLNRYVTDQHIPRPESYAEDIHTAAAAGHGPTDPSAQILYAEIAAAAESGMDFSSRWFSDGRDISTCDTSHVLPADLNAFLYLMERDLADFARTLADAHDAQCGRKGDGGSQPQSPPPPPPHPQPQPPRTGAASTDAAIVYCRRNPDKPACRSNAVPRGVKELADRASRKAAAAYVAVDLDWDGGEGLLAPSPFSAVAAAGSGGVSGGGQPPVRGMVMGGPPPPQQQPQQQQQQQPTSPDFPAQCSLLHLPSDDLRADEARYTTAAENRAAAMEALMWDEELGSWADLRVHPSALPHGEPTGDPHALSSSSAAHSAAGSGAAAPRPATSAAVAARYRERTDLRLGTTVSRIREPMASNFVPVWAGLGGVRTNATRARRVAEALEASGLRAPGGVFTTLSRTREQWDWPNAWAPIQHMLAVGLEATGEPSAVAVGRDIARGWLRSGLAAFSRSGYSHEKYDARGVGVGGGGGEYAPQVGFGWTNGVALDFALRFDFESLEEKTAAEPGEGEGGRV
jgi:neutral trehalase